MEIKDVIEKKKVAEKSIMDIIDTLQLETGLAISDISVNITTTGLLVSTYSIVDIEIKIEL